MPLITEENHPIPAMIQRRAFEHAALSVLVPGLGQFAQRRPLSGIVQFATVVGYVVAALSLGGGRAAWLAVAWSVWSAVDAYRHEHD
jgi:TM2 domain-containing membrane protein YozV